MLNNFNFWMNVIRDGLQYSIFECVFLLLILFDLRDGDITMWLLLPAAMLAVMWMVATNTADAFEEAKEMVLHRELFMSDFIISAIVLTLIAYVVRHEEWYYSTLFVLAAVQNLRYSLHARRWIMETIRDERERRPDSDDNV